MTYLPPELPKQCLCGDEEAWIHLRSWLAAQAPRLPIGSTFLDHQEAEDVVQQVMVQLCEEDCRRLKSYSGRGSFEGFILTIARRTAISLIRKNVRARGKTNLTPDELEFSDFPNHDQQEFWLAAEQYLKDEDVLVLRMTAAGLKDHEIAVEFSLQRGAAVPDYWVTQHRERALKKLAKILNDPID